MSLAEAQALVHIVATVIGIFGGLLALYKYFSDKRDKELREWQKVVVYKIFRQNETEALAFTDVLEKYRLEAQAFVDVNLKKKEISEDALRRILLELASSNILSLEPLDSFRLKMPEKKPDFLEIHQRLNQELVQMVASNPFVYTVDEVVKAIAPKVGIDIPILRNELRKSIKLGFFVVDESERIAFSR